MSALTPEWPTRADHRFILKMVKLTLDGKIVLVPNEFSRVSRVFSKAGGSWERVFHGSPDDVTLLKTVLKVAYKHGYLTKQQKWV
jgi:hypothetical protein